MFISLHSATWLGYLSLWNIWLALCLVANKSPPGFFPGLSASLWKSCLFSLSSYQPFSSFLNQSQQHIFTQSKQIFRNISQCLADKENANARFSNSWLAVWRVSIALQTSLVTWKSVIEENPPGGIVPWVPHLTILSVWRKKWAKVHWHSTGRDLSMNCGHGTMCKELICVLRF